MQTTFEPASAPVVRPPLPYRARHPSGVWIPCPSCGLEQPEAPDCAVCGAEMGVPAKPEPSPPAPSPHTPSPPTLPSPEPFAPAPAPIQPAPARQPGRYATAERVELGVAADYRGGELSRLGASPVVVLGFLVLGAFAFFFAASWFIDFTRGEMRAMAEVVDRLALPTSACESCEKPFRIVELRARPYYDPPLERTTLLDSDRDASSRRWVEEMRLEVEEAKAWAEQNRQWQEEEAERLAGLGD